MAEHKLDIFRVLSALDNQDFSLYSSLTDEERKSLAPVVIMRWMSHVAATPPNMLNIERQQYYLCMINDMVNCYFWELSKHPELQMMLMAVCGLGQKCKHGWIAGSKAKTDEQKRRDCIRYIYPHYNDQELDLIINGIPKDELLAIIELSGQDVKKVKPLFKG